MKRFSWILLLMMAGCAAKVDPFPRIEPGAKLIAYDPLEDQIQITTPQGEGSVGTDWTLIPVGTNLVLVSDEAGRSDADRPVRVRVIDGKYQGTGTLPRKSVRPSP